MGKKSLLLVDGDEKSRRVLEVSLKKAGYVVTTAQNGREALERVGTAHPDLIISDTRMEQLDGFEFCREIKKRPALRDIPFIFLTAEKSLGDKIRGLELGVEDYLTKPIYIKEILTRVRLLLSRKDRSFLESSVPGTTQFAGRLSDMAVVDLIQTLEIGRKSGVIQVTASERRRASVYFRNGAIVDAETGQLQGAEALYRVLTWTEGKFEVQFKNVRRKDVIGLSAQSLLMEGMRRVDEWGRLLEQMPQVDKVFEVDYAALGERLADMPDQTNAVLRLFDGRRTLLQVVEDGVLGDLESMSLIARLYFDGLIVPAQKGAPVPEVSPAVQHDAIREWLARSGTPQVQETRNRVPPARVLEADDFNPDEFTDERRATRDVVDVVGTHSERLDADPAEDDDPMPVALSPGTTDLTDAELGTLLPGGDAAVRAESMLLPPPPESADPFDRFSLDVDMEDTAAAPVAASGGGFDDEPTPLPEPQAPPPDTIAFETSPEHVAIGGGVVITPAQIEVAAADAEADADVEGDQAAWRSPVPDAAVAQLEASRADAPTVPRNQPGQGIGVVDTRPPASARSASPATRPPHAPPPRQAAPPVASAPASADEVPSISDAWTAPDVATGGRLPTSRGVASSEAPLPGVAVARVALVQRPASAPAASAADTVKAAPRGVAPAAAARDVASSAPPADRATAAEPVRSPPGGPNTAPPRRRPPTQPPPIPPATPLPHLAPAAASPILETIRGTGASPPVVETIRGTGAVPPIAPAVAPAVGATLLGPGVGAAARPPHVAVAAAAAPATGNPGSRATTVLTTQSTSPMTWVVGALVVVALGVGMFALFSSPSPRAAVPDASSGAAAVSAVDAAAGSPDEEQLPLPTEPARAPDATPVVAARPDAAVLAPDATPVAANPAPERTPPPAPPPEDPPAPPPERVPERVPTPPPARSPVVAGGDPDEGAAPADDRRRRRALLDRARRASNGGDKAEALVLTDEALELDPKDGSALALRANLLLDLGRSAEAMAACDKALRLNDRNADAWLAKAHIHYDGGQTGPARAAFERFLALRPEGKQADSVRTILESL